MIVNVYKGNIREGKQVASYLVKHEQDALNKFLEDHFIKPNTIYLFIPLEKYLEDKWLNIYLCEVLDNEHCYEIKTKYIKNIL